MIKLTELCPVCGGKGKFLNTKCSKCNGSGGKIVPFDSRFMFYFQPHLDKLTEQERRILDMYFAHFTQSEISLKLDISKHSVIFLLHHIEIRINQTYQEIR